MIRIDQITSDTASQEGPILPLAGLIGLLRAADFRVKPDDYLEMLKVVENNFTEDPAQLKYRLCPLLATNEEEQARFYKVFDEYIRQQLLQQVVGKKARLSGVRRRLVFIVILVVVLTGLYIFIRWPVLPQPAAPEYKARFNILNQTQLQIPPYYAVPGDTLELNASSVFTSGIQDTVHSRISWDLGNGWVYPNQLQCKYVVSPKAAQLLQLKVESGKHRELVSIDSEAVHSCIKVLIGLAIDGSEQVTGKPVRLTPLYRGDTAAIGRLNWFVNGALLDDTNRQLVDTFFTPGFYEVECRFTTPCSFSPRQRKVSQSTNIGFEVKDGNNQFAVSVQQSGPAFNRPPYLLKSWLWWLLLLAPGLVFVYALFRDRKAQRSAAVTTGKNKLPSEGPETKKDPASPPYEVPMENRDLRLIVREQDMYPLFRSMRSKVEDEGLALNIPLSIQTVIRTGGVPDLVFTNKLREEEYLILIDEANIKSQQLKLFDYLAKLLEEENVRVNRFYYRHFDSFYNTEFPSGISLKRLQQLYPSNTLIVFGNAEQLIYHSFTVETKILSVLEEWEYKGILTPEPWPDWGIRENILKKHFILLPADIQGQVRLIAAMKEKQLRQEKFLSGQEKWYEARSYSFSDVSKIRDYLGDEDLFQWLCAICTYPKIRWEVIIEVGAALFTKMGKPEKLNFTNLLRLVRIKWMREGVFPERTRLELLKNLTIPNELTARVTILDLLKYAAIYFGDDHFFEAERKLQQLTNEFILFANNGKEEYKGSYELFRERWKEKKIFDGPLKRYLDKQEGDNWSTPVLSDGKNTGIETYFGLTDKVVAEEKRKNRRRPYYRALAVLAVSGVLLLFNKVIFDNGLGRSLHLVSQDSASRQITFHIKVADSCKNVYFMLDDTVRGLLTIGNERDTFFFKKGAANLLLHDRDLLKDGSLQLFFGPNSVMEQTAITPIRLTNTTVSLTVNHFCRQREDSARSPKDTARKDSAQKDTTQAGYSSVNLPGILNEIWHGGTSNRLININTGQRVIYYSVNDVNTFGTFHIEQVLGTKSGVYKIITSTQLQGYKPFFIKNVTNNSFELSVCQRFYKTIAEIQQMNETYCDKFNTMSLYYEKNDSVIYLPVDLSGTIYPTEEEKLQRFGKRDVTYAVSSYRNSIYLTNNSLGVRAFISNVFNQIQRRNAYLGADPIDQPNPNPFRRNYMTIKEISDTRQSINPSSTIVIPDSNTFYPPGRSSTETRDTTSSKTPPVINDLDFGTVNLDNKGNPDQKGMALIDTIAGMLMNLSQKQVIILRGDYVTSADKDILNRGMNIIEKNLTGRGQKISVNFNLAGPVKFQGVQQSSKTPVQKAGYRITIYGSNFPINSQLEIFRKKK